MTDEQETAAPTPAAPSPAGSDASEHEVKAVEISHDELVAEADQFLDLSGADPETHGQEPDPA